MGIFGGGGSSEEGSAVVAEDEEEGSAVVAEEEEEGSAVVGAGAGMASRVEVEHREHSPPSLPWH